MLVDAVLLGLGYTITCVWLYAIACILTFAAKVRVDALCAIERFWSLFLMQSKSGKNPTRSMVLRLKNDKNMEHKKTRETKRDIYDYHVWCSSFVCCVYEIYCWNWNSAVNSSLYFITTRVVVVF